MLWTFLLPGNSTHWGGSPADLARPRPGFLPGGDQEMGEDHLHGGCCLGPETWRWWLFCSPVAIHECGSGRDPPRWCKTQSPQSPSLPRGTQDEETPPHTPRQAWEHLGGRVLGSRRAGLERDVSTQHPRDHPGLSLLTRPPCTTPTSHAQPGTVCFFN